MPSHNAFRPPGPASARARCWVFAALGLAGWLTLLVLRVAAVRAGPGTYTGCAPCVDAPVLLNDLLPTALLAGLALLASLLRPGVWRSVPVLAAAGVIVLYFIDLGIYLLLGMRLRIADLWRYGGETRSTWSVVAPLLAEPRGMALLAGLLLAVVGWAGLLWTVPRRKPSAIFWGAATAALLTATLLAPAGDSVDAVTFRDVLRANRPDGINQPFSPAFRQALLALPPERPGHACTAAGAQGALPRSDIQLVVESLSANHSQLLGGLQDSTPHLDAWARKASYFPEFVANGFTTDGGLIALLTGRVPLPTIGRYESTHAYAGYEQPVVPDLFARLGAAGYQTQFFTTGDLGFLDKGGWLRQLGFGHVEGAEQPFYARFPRGSFNAAGDQALYARYLDWYDHQRTGPLNFSTLLTVTTHPPYVVPGTEVRDEAGAFRWADAQIDQFIQALAARRYFDHGVLLVTGDHRAMTTVRPGEVARFGASAPARTPMVVIGPAGLPAGPVQGRSQQIDFLAGLLDLAAQPSCTDAFRGRLLGAHAAPARYVLHALGGQRDHVRTWTRDDERARDVVLDGDHTHWADTPPTEPSARQVLDQVNRERAALSPVPRNFFDQLIGGKLGRP